MTARHRRHAAAPGARSRRRARGWIGNPWGRPRFLVVVHLGVHAVGDRPGPDRGAVLVQQQPLAHDLGGILDPLVHQRPELGHQRPGPHHALHAEPEARRRSTSLIATPHRRAAGARPGALARARLGRLQLHHAVPAGDPRDRDGRLAAARVHATCSRSSTRARSPRCSGHVTFSISYVVVIVRGRLFSIGKQYEEAAADLGASPRVALTKVLLPLLTPAIVAGAAIMFAISIDDFVISLLALERRAARHGADRRSTRRRAPRRCRPPTPSPRSCR